MKVIIHSIDEKFIESIIELANAKNYVIENISKGKNVFVLGPLVEPTINILFECIDKILKIPRKAIESKYRGRDTSDARSIFCYIVHNYVCPDLSYQRLGYLIGNRDHSTVIHNLKKFDKLNQTDKLYNQKYRNLMDLLIEHRILPSLLINPTN